MAECWNIGSYCLVWSWFLSRL